MYSKDRLRVGSAIFAMKCEGWEGACAEVVARVRWRGPAGGRGIKRHSLLMRRAAARGVGA